MKWVTWEQVGVDRMACAWLIKKYIDPQAEFLFVPVGHKPLSEGAEPFDIPGVRLSHHRGHCTFHTMLREYDLRDPVLERIARVVDRTRVITAEIASLEVGTSEYHVRLSQLERLQVRAQLLLKALRIFYACLGSFAAAALISVVGSALAFYDQRVAFHAAAVVGLATGGLGVTGLVSGCMLMVRETTLAVQNLAKEAELARTRYAGGQPPGRPPRA